MERRSSPITFPSTLCPVPFLHLSPADIAHWTVRRIQCMADLDEPLVNNAEEGKVQDKEAAEPDELLAVGSLRCLHSTACECNVLRASMYNV